jgi:hypothetical protein
LVHFHHLVDVLIQSFKSAYFVFDHVFEVAKVVQVTTLHVLDVLTFVAMLTVVCLHSIHRANSVRTAALCLRVVHQHMQVLPSISWIMSRAIVWLFEILQTLLGFDVSTVRESLMNISFNF